MVTVAEAIETAKTVAEIAGNVAGTAGNTIATVGKKVKGAYKNHQLAKEAERRKKYKYKPTLKLRDQAFKDVMLDIQSGNMLGGEAPLQELVEARYQAYLAGTDVPYDELARLNADPKWRKKMSLIRTNVTAAVDPQAPIIGHVKEKRGWFGGTSYENVSRETNASQKIHAITAGGHVTGDEVQRSEVKNKAWTTGGGLKDLEQWDEDHYKQLKREAHHMSQNKPNWENEEQKLRDKYDAKLKKLKQKLKTVDPKDSDRQTQIVNEINETNRKLENASNTVKHRKEQWEKDYKQVQDDIQEIDNQEELMKTPEATHKVHPAPNPHEIDENLHRAQKKNEVTWTDVAKSMARDGSDMYVNDWLGTSKTANMLNKLGGGTSLGKFMTNIASQALKDRKDRSLRNLPWEATTGALHEGIGGLLAKHEEGNMWSPTLAAGINAASSVFGLNPIARGALDIGSLVLTSPTLRNGVWNATKWTVGKVGDLASWTGSKIKNLFTMHKPDVIPMAPRPPIRQHEISQDSINIPNIGTAYESRDNYMKRLTGDVGPVKDNDNKITFTGPRSDKPQYEKLANRVMLAAPSLRKRVKVKTVNGKRFIRRRKHK